MEEGQALLHVPGMPTQGPRSLTGIHPLATAREVTGMKSEPSAPSAGDMVTASQAGCIPRACLPWPLARLGVRYPKGQGGEPGCPTE